MGSAAASGASGAAGPLSVASLGLSAASTIMKGEGTQAADNMHADQLTQAAQFGETQATLTDTTMRQNLSKTLGNIEAVRAAANTDPNSPTSVALMDQSTQRSDTQRMAAVGTIKTQDETDLASASYLKQAGSFAMTQSYIGAAAGVAAGVGKALTLGV